ncbi:MBL fold metallo-hydrolase [Leifsonia sp. 1010]|uniref:MBL fold metallo-hydrolase n=1 Tax=Leifsonia sp. 1010 TaxID=2817769 RepID=UPI00285537BA|nr:MBL fold metallo-hydrolase [Leifsonia sp. 1010]MDR6610728.1 glyoxylase-like metal-dependent hydrolase (beta-lactamase superfamily II) [Leifsonia sp. 1010]
MNGTDVALPIVENWYRREWSAPGIERIDEPHVHEFLRANIWRVVGQDRDLVVDAGLGVASLRERAADLFEHAPVLVLTHAHLDHVGSAHEFPDRRMHRYSQVNDSTPATLRGPELAGLLGVDWPDMPALLVDAVPRDFEVDSYGVHSAPPTTILDDGDLVDLGDRRLRVLHLPGHTSGSLCLFDEQAGALFSGDVIYDDILLDGLDESDIDQYVQSMLRLRDLPVRTVYPGHGDPFDGTRMLEIIDDYLSSRPPQTPPGC